MVPGKPKRLARRLLWGLAALIGLGALSIVGPLVHTMVASAGKEFAADDVPARDVGLVLGARVYDNGEPSPFLRARLDLAAQLYQSGKVKVLLVSGGNTAQANYETDVMVAYLVRMGVPPEKVVADPLGLNTFDSCIRARKVFQVRSATVITQGYHLPRALTLCSCVGIDAVGVGDYTRRYTSNSWAYGQFRELLAGVKMELDLLLGSTEGGYDASVDKALGR